MYIHLLLLTFYGLVFSLDLKYWVIIVIHFTCSESERMRGGREGDVVWKWGAAVYLRSAVSNTEALWGCEQGGTGNGPQIVIQGVIPHHPSVPLTNILAWGKNCPYAHIELQSSLSARGLRLLTDPLLRERKNEQERLRNNVAAQGALDLQKSSAVSDELNRDQVGLDWLPASHCSHIQV